MALSGPKQAIQALDPKLGIVDNLTATYLVRLCKGQVSYKEGKWFYHLFLDPRYYGVPSSIEDVRAILQQAWWVEEEDLQQEITLLVLRLGWNPDKYILPGIALNLRDHLVHHQKVFARQTDWERDYQLEDCFNREPRRPLEQIGLRLLVDKETASRLPVSLFYKYITYLAYVLKLSRHELSKALLCNSRQASWFKAKVKCKLKELSYVLSTENAG
jgi:hypothetical protein